jgi:biopolymer transport protein ExbD
MVNRQAVNGRSAEVLAESLADAAKAGKDSVVIISADATATHQSVITVMEAARRVGLTQITFATQSSAQAGAQ